MSDTSDTSGADPTDKTPSPAQPSSPTSTGVSRPNLRQDVTPNVRNTRSSPRPLNLQGGRRASTPDGRPDSGSREDFEGENKYMAVEGQTTRASKMMEEARSALTKLQTARERASPKEKREAFEANIEVLKTTVCIYSWKRTGKRANVTE